MMKKQTIFFLTNFLTAFIFNAKAEFIIQGGLGVASVKSEIEDVIFNSEKNSTDASLMIGGGYFLENTTNFRVGFGLDIVGYGYTNKQSFKNKDYQIEVKNFTSSMFSVKLLKNFEKFDIYGAVGFGAVARNVKRVYYPDKINKDENLISSGMGATIGSSYKISEKSSIFTEVRYIGTKIDQTTDQVGEKTNITLFMIGYRYHFI